MHDSLIYEIALSIVFRNRLSMAHRLLSTYPSAAEVWTHIEEPDMSKALARAEQEAAWMTQHGITAHFCLSDDYPYRLSQCPDAPLLLYGKGKIDFNTGHFVSVVGTRNATDRGRELTRQFVLDLARLVPDVTIVSGLAYGIDVAAHRAAIEAGVPTIIVPGHGLDRIYPPLHRDVAVSALQNGGLLTEYISGTEPFAGNFVARDRIIAGLSDATIVVESKERGGSLITAQMALDYDRQVFAFPGRPSDITARGCNALIRDSKAALIESADDFVRAMMWEPEQKAQPIQTELIELTETLDETERILLSKLHENEDGLHINLLVMETGLQYAQVSAALMMMEIRGITRSLPGGIYRALK